MTLLLGKLKFSDLMKVPRRCKNGPNHWSMLRKKVAAKDKALEYFDEFYHTIYGDSWSLIRAALMKKPSKYIAVLNNFGDTEKTIEKFELIGAIDFKAIYEVHKKNLACGIRKAQAQDEDKNNDNDLNILMKNVHGQKDAAVLKSVYPDGYQPASSSLQEASEYEGGKKADEPLHPVQLRSIEENATETIQEEGRIVKTMTGVASSSLHEYIPATKIKGLDDWVLESEHYSYYNRGADFSIKVEKDPVLRFPEHLKIYTFEALNDSKFPTPKRGSSGLYDFYLMDGGSILPVLALDLQPGDTVLDMCAAPGGKSYAALQTLMPRVLVANDVRIGRIHQLNDVIEEYFGDTDVWKSRLFVTNKDARSMEEMNMFNKIIVDVPCTTDRHVLHTDDNNMFKPTRLRERLRLPELQSEILGHALKLVAPGGTVVYSTCSLSPIQNDGVVQMALKKNWEETDSAMTVMDMTEALEPLRCLYKFGNYGLKYGHIVIPTKANNWGPMYFCKIMRAR